MYKSLLRSVSLRKCCTTFSTNVKEVRISKPVLNEFLLNLLVCPITKQELYYDGEVNAFVSIAGQVAFRVPDNDQINLLPRGPLVASIAEEQ